MANISIRLHLSRENGNNQEMRVSCAFNVNCTTKHKTGDAFNEDFEVKNIARTAIRTSDLPTCFFIIADAPSIKAFA